MHFFKYLLLFFCYLCDYLDAAAIVNKSTEEGWDNVFSTYSYSVPLFEFGEKNYYVSKSKLTFLEAYQFCQEIQMQLVTIHTSEEVDALTNFVRQTSTEQAFWTSGSRLVDGKNWIWMSTMEIVEYTKWSKGQPDYLTEQCLAIWFHDSRELYFNNDNCNSKNAFICETGKRSHRVTREIESSSNLFSLDRQYVPSNINFHFEGKSYYIGNYFKATFLQSMQFCQMIGMKLVAIDSDAESKRLHKYIRDTIAGDNFWSSGSKLVDGKSIIWLSNGRPADYTNWLPNQPDNLKEMCIELVQKKNEGLFWNDLDCEAKHFFICEQHDNVLSKKTEPISELVELKPTIVQSTAPAAESVSQYPENPTLPMIVFEEGKYRISKYATTQEKSSQTCKQYGMELVSVLDKSKNDVIMKLIQQINDSIPAGSYWTSATKQQDGKWIWWELQPVVYTNWRPNEPNSVANSEHCLELLYPSSQWNDVRCDHELHFICESSSFRPSSNTCNSRPLPVLNVYVNKNQDSGAKNVSTTQYKNIVLSRDGEKYNIEVDNTTLHSSLYNFLRV